nr:probable WRKY transcription factor 50 [Tanacetum cinerariifolium]
MDAYDPMPNKSYSYTSVDSPDIDYDVPHQQNSEFFDNFFVLDEWMNEDQASIVPEYQDHTLAYASPVFDDGSPSIGSSSSSLQGNSNLGGTGMRQAQKATKEKVAFRTKSQVEVLDDGFKWRKYGKKMVKNSPNPRNYYRCSAEGCSVKKRVERDVEDARYVITTYEGIHNHQRPSNF